MGINKNFVIKNGLEVYEDLLFANPIVNAVGIKTAIPTCDLDINGTACANSATFGPPGVGSTLALYVDGDASITGTLFVDDLNLDTLTANTVSVAGSVTAATYYGDGSNLTGLVTLGLVIALS